MDVLASRSSIFHASLYALVLRCIFRMIRMGFRPAKTETAFCMGSKRSLEPLGWPIADLNVFSSMPKR